MIFYYMLYTYSFGDVVILFYMSYIYLFRDVAISYDPMCTCVDVCHVKLSYHILSHKMCQYLYIRMAN